MFRLIILFLSFTIFCFSCDSDNNTGVVEKDTGWTAFIDNEYSIDNAFNLMPNTVSVLPNNAGVILGDFSGKYSNMYNPETQKIEPALSGLSGDFRVDFSVSLPDGERDAVLRIRTNIGDTTDIVISPRSEVITTEFTEWYPVSIGYPFYCLSTFVKNGGKIELESDERVIISNISYLIKVDTTP